MTIQGAIAELIGLLNADDIPIYYKSGIKKVIETIDDYIDGQDDYVKRRTEQTRCEECDHWDDTEDGCAERHDCKTEPNLTCTVDCDLFKKDGTCLGCYRYDICHSSPDCPWK